MIIFFFSIILFFIIYGLYDFKKSFLTFAAVSMLMGPAYSIKYSPPAITCMFSLSIFYLILFYARGYYKRGVKERFFLKKPFVYMTLSFIISTTFSVVDAGFSGWTGTINKILTSYMLIFMFWKITEDRNEIHFFFKTICVVFTIVFIYGLFEFFKGDNPLLETITNSMPADYAQDKIYLSDLTDDSRGGRARCQSLFSISILYGIATMLFLFFFLQISKYKYFMNISKKVIIVVTLFVLFAQYACNSKTAIAALPVFIMPWMMRNIFMLFMDVLLIVIFLFFQENVINIVSVFIDLNAFNADDNTVGGSSLYLRLLQFEAAFEHWGNSFFIGNGIRSGAILSMKDTRLFGCESIWIRTVVEQGLLGLIAYFLLIVSCLKQANKANDKWPIVFFILGFFVICSITDIDYNLFFMLLIIMIKVDRMYTLT